MNSSSTTFKEDRRVLDEKNGGAEPTNLEPSDYDRIFSELEDWSDILRNEPAVIHQLSAFAEAAEGDDSSKEETAPELPTPEVSP